MIWQKVLEVFWRIYLDIIFWILLWILTSLLIWNLNITVSITLKYCYKKALNKKLKLMGGAMKYFPKKLLGHEIFRPMVSRATKFFFFFEKFVETSGPSPTYLMYAPYAWFSENARCFVRTFLWIWITTIQTRSFTDWYSYLLTDKIFQ